MKITVLFAAVIGAVLAGTAFAQEPAMPAAASKPGYTQKEMELRTELRRIFSDHVTWQRVAAIELRTAAKDRAKAADRLNKNAGDIGNAFKPFYGNDTAGKVTDLFKKHILLLADYVNDAKAGGKNKAAIEKKMEQNADATAALLSKANPAWPQKELSTMFRAHAQDLRAEIDLQQKDLGALDVAAMDRAVDHAMMMADVLAFGIMQQFPDKMK